MSNLIQSFPNEIYGHILHQLTNVTGSRGIVNKADIPFVMRYAANLTCTCKEIVEKVNSAEAVNMFINSLANKYNKSYLHIASVLNTETARTWIWSHIKEKDYLQVYQTIHEILDHTDMSTDQKAGIVPTACSNQTICGYILNVIGKNENLSTPLGVVPFSSHKGLTVIPAGFFHCPFYVNGISPETMLCCLITDVGQRKLPDVTIHESTKTHLTDESIEKIWNMIKAEKMGQDPITYKIIKRKISFTSCSKVNFKNISKISKWGINLIQEIELRAPFERHLYIKGRKMRILCSLNSLANDYLEKGSERHLSVKSNGHVEFKTSEGHVPCNLKPLEKAYDSAISSFSQNWFKVELKDHPSQLNLQSEEDHVLFFKKEFSYHEYRLLCSLRTQLKAFNNIDFRYRSDEDKSMYLWIKKDNLEKTLTALGIQ